MKRLTISVALVAAVAAVCLTSCAQLDENTVHYGTNVIKLNAANFQQQVVASTKPVLVDFWAPWCGPCREMVPTISALADEYQGRVVFGSVNVDDETALAEKFNIEGIPAVFIFKDGKPVHQLIGLREKPEFQQVLNQVLSGKPVTASAQ
jgi:thioredoxin